MSQTVGILGGGQLGAMLAMAAARLGVATIILDPDPVAPAARVAGEHLIADYVDTAALATLADRCDIVTYEFENVPEAAVSALADRVDVRPGRRALTVAQDRLEEKRFLRAIGLETAPFVPADSQDGLVDAVAELGGPVIVKTRRLGYDGKGQLRIPGPGAVPGSAFDDLGQVPLIVEALVDFESELSVIVVRNTAGELRCYDPATNVHRDGILHTSTVPASIGTETERRARAAAEALATALDYVGVLGLELFVTSDGSVMANEFAPRVHNSGHWTEAACIVSQFEQHIRAVVGLPLGSTQRWADAAMTNLIGDDVLEVPALLAEPAAVVHLYGKAERRPGRKMGHVTRLSARADGLTFCANPPSDRPPNR